MNLYLLAPSLFDSVCSSVSRQMQIYMMRLRIYSLQAGNHLGQLSLATAPSVGAMSTSESWDVNRPNLAV